MGPMRRALRLTLVLAALALVATGCGNKTAVQTIGETEGTYLDIDDLQYQIQISRYLNANDVEDQTYLKGLPTGTEQPAGDETWFGIFMRVQNSTDRTITPANDFEIIDTLDNVYRPIPLDPEVNGFAYQPNPIAPRSLIPKPDSIPSEGVIQGSLLLFKLKTDSLQNRPLEFRFRRGSGSTATVDLDV
jgi:hypothetical protein